MRGERKPDEKRCGIDTNDEAELMQIDVFRKDCGVGRPSAITSTFNLIQYLNQTLLNWTETPPGGIIEREPGQTGLRDRQRSKFS